jgi:hypothetical protein
MEYHFGQTQMTKLDQALAVVEQARTEPETKQDLLAEAVMLTVRRVQASDDLGLNELSLRMTKLAEATDLTEAEAQKIAWGNG